MALQLSIKTLLALVLLGITQMLQSAMNNKLVELVGVVSYEFYLVHYRLLGLPGKGIAGMIAFIFISIVLSVALYYAIQKITKSVVRR